jgi:hypothetical protein
VPTTDCLPQLRVDFHPEQPVVLSFDAPQTSSDGGLLLVRQIDDTLGLTALVAAAMPDTRDPRKVVHPREEQVRQRIFQIVQGYEDGNDATTLRYDPLFRVVCERSGAQGSAGCRTARMQCRGVSAVALFSAFIARFCHHDRAARPSEPPVEQETIDARQRTRSDACAVALMNNTG